MRTPRSSARACLAFLAATAVMAGAASLGAQETGAAGRRAARDLDRAERFFASGDLGSATSLFRRAVQSDPGSSAGYLGLARTYRARGDLREAEAVLESGRRRVPGSFELTRALLELRIERGEGDRAQQELPELLRRFPERSELRRLAAELAQEAGRFSEALAAHRAVLDLEARGRSVRDEDLAAARALAPALVLLLGDRDPVARCGATPVRRALCARGR